MHAIRRSRTLPIGAAVLAALLGVAVASCDAVPRTGVGRDAATTSTTRPAGTAALALTPVPWPTSIEAVGVAAAPAGFVAVGSGGVAVSRDGRTWEAVAGAPADLRLVVAGGPGVVAAGGSAIWTSPDGRRWTRAVTPAVAGAAVGIAAIAAGRDGLVALGDGGGGSGPVALRSRDGTRWVAASRGPGARRAGYVPRALLAGPHGYVAVLDLGRRGAPSEQVPIVSTSADGVDWREPVRLGPAESTVTQVVAAGSSLVAVGSVRTTTLRSGAAGASDRTVHVDAAAWTSSDGITWERAPHDEDVFGGAGAQELHDAVVTTSGVVAVGVDDGPLGETEAVVWRSPDGRRWSRAGAGVAVPRSLAAPLAVAAGGGAVVTVGGGARAWRARPAAGDTRRSPWRSVDVPGGGIVSGVTATRSGFVAVGERDGRAATWRSPDGLRWEPGAVDEQGVVGPSAMRAVARAGSVLVAVGTGGVAGSPEQDAAAWRSDDGVTWRRVLDDGDGEPVFGGPGRQEVVAVAAGPEGVVAVGRDDATGTFDGAVWRTVDGTSWERVAVDPGGFGGLGDDVPRAVVRTGQRWLVAGAAGTRGPDGLDLDVALWTSADGTVWDRVGLEPNDTGGPGDQVATTLAVADDGEVLVGGYESPNDGETDARLWRLDGNALVVDRSPGWSGAGRQAVNALAAVDGRTVAVGVAADRAGAQDLRSWVGAVIDPDQRSVGQRDEDDYALAVAGGAGGVVAAGTRFWWRAGPVRPATGAEAATTGRGGGR